MEKTCKFCKDGYPYFTNDGVVCWCYLSAIKSPVKKKMDDTCPDWHIDPEWDLENDENE